MLRGDLDTIAAISTAKGTGALGIVRISGPQTDEIVKTCFSPPQTFESHRAYYGLWKNPKTNQAVDEVLLLHFEKGRGFTGENAVEVICHGGMQVTDLVLRASLDGGARLARPGEFTYRAVMNDKLDLAQAESVLDLINARTPKAAAQALSNIRGALSQTLEELESKIIYVLAHLEAAIDFSTEDIQPVSYADMLARTDFVMQTLQTLLDTFISGKVSRQGLQVVLAGKPNVGKSSLLNALVGKDRSIVNALPGTTRDLVDAEILIDGALYCLTDTAGLRVAENEIEKIGVARAREALKSADLVLYVVEQSQKITAEDVQTILDVGLERVLLCFNKSDLVDDNAPQVLPPELSGLAHVSSSTLNLSGMAALRKALQHFVKFGSDAEMTSVVSTERQRVALEKAKGFLAEAAELLAQNASPDLISFALREALLSVQEVLGKDAGDDVMDRVFKEFCIGK